ncbi:MAG: sodium:solute symporter [Gemmatimonadota bacterium]
MSRFGSTDLLIVVAYLLGVTAWGTWLGRGQRGGREYFLGNRELPWGAVMLSVVATETSTLTFLSIPGVAYLGTLAFLQLAAGYVAGRIVVARLLLPAYYEGELTTAYELLETRFGPTTRRFTSGIFMFTRLLADSVRLFATAIPLALLTGWSYSASILLIGGATLLYTYAGGIRAVVWVDAVQMGLYMAGGLLAAAFLQQMVPGGWGYVAARAAEAGKLVLVDPSPDLRLPYTLWAGLLGGAFLSMGSHGTDQLIVQRLLTCRDFAASRRALIGSGIVVLFQFALFLALGLGLWAFYGGREFVHADEIFSRFIVEELPAGLRGLLLAGVFAAAMSSLSSSINSLASATTYDYWEAWRGRKAGERARLAAGRAFSLGWAGLLVGGAILFIPLGRETTAVEVALGIASLVYGGLLGAFALALFVSRARQAHAITGIVCGIVAVSGIWAAGRLSERPLLAWPWYVLLGSAITFAVGLALSALPPRSPWKNHGGPRVGPAEEIPETRRAMRR